MIQLRILGISVLIASTAACASGPARSCDDLPRVPAASNHAADDAVDRMVGYWPNIVLTTHQDEEVRFYDDLVRGKCVLINFMYATCDGI